MVILAASVCTKSGKALVSRQFRDISRIRIEGLLSAFPKLMNPKSQHTFVETDTVRYVYQPLENLFLLLITTKSSNIVEDLDTLQLVSLVVKDQCQSITTEEVVLDKAFEIMFAMDEVISLGYKEKVTLDQVKTILEMESHAENIQNLITQTKIEDAIQSGKRRAMEIAVDKAANKGRIKTGISRDDYMPSGGGMGSVTTNIDTRQEERHIGRDPFAFSSNKGIGKTTPTSSSTPEYPTPYKPETKAKPPSMVLKPKSKGAAASSLVKDLIKSGEVEEEEEVITRSPTTRGSEESLNVSTPISTRQELREGVHVTLEEKIRAEVNHEGGPAKIEIKGEMFLTIAEGANGNIRVKLNKDRASESQFATKLHPNIDKKPFAEQSLLGLKSAKRAFPTGNPLKILTWRLQEPDDESVLPLSVSSWPNVSSDGVSVSVEYELTRKDLQLNNLVIKIPIPQQQRGANVKVEDLQTGSYRYDQKNSELVWNLEDIDADLNPTGSLEFTVPSGDESGFFPISIQFTSKQTLSQIRVEDVITAEGNDHVKHSLDQKLVVSEYHIV
jgi:hypothetical protein